MDHRFESKIDLARADDLSDILHRRVSNLAISFLDQEPRTYTRIIRLKESNLDTLILEKALGLSQVKRRMIRRSVPSPKSSQPTHPIISRESKGQANQFVKKVILSEDMVVALLQSVRPALTMHQRGEEEACSFRSYYADQVRNGVFSASSPATSRPFLYPFGGQEKAERPPTSKHPPACCYFTLTKRHCAREQHVSLHWLSAVPDWVSKSEVCG